MGQNNILIVHNFVKEAPDGFHLFTADRAHQELSDAVSRVLSGPMAENFRLLESARFSQLYFSSKIIIYLNAKSKLLVCSVKSGTLAFVFVFVVAFP